MDALLKPSLYTPAATLLGGRCACGHVFYPMQTHGCEVCGRHGGDLQPMTLSGRGTLLSSTVVHLHADKARPAPFSIGKIALEEGPVVRTLLVDPAPSIAPGTAMKATLVPVEDGKRDLRFAPER
ncbi:MAG: OB-fold domain-containing protein [Reyranella sp.]|uniref:Zn-ribbon domain-containing OB-fold protein n=1 Tax=Reyranella sp. TaxID=1929291 RepID=UPI001AC4C528|nr:OB-fold domain-containing protein [Reyranella sp.]MBN9086800.1 OB-fold domain-containing protein [Reyranella sp.]